MMLIDASCPSNNAVADTMRTLLRTAPSDPMPDDSNWLVMPSSYRHNARIRTARP